MLEKDRAEIFGKNLSRLMAEQKKTQADIVRLFGSEANQPPPFGAAGKRTFHARTKLKPLCKMFECPVFGLVRRKSPSPIKMTS